MARGRHTLPPRPRRHGLGIAQFSLIGVLLLAAGFLGGVLVEKGSGSGASAATGGFPAAAQFAQRARSSASAPSFGAASGGTARTSTSLTSGEVSYVDHGTLYVTTSEGGTVKVEASEGSTVTKSVKTSARSIRPGETVLVTGTRESNGTISARRVVVGSSGVSSLFGGGTPGASSGSSSSSSGSSSTPQLFGSG